MPTQHRRPVAFVDHEGTMPNTPSPFDGYMQQLDLMFPAKIVSLPDGLSTLHIRHPKPEWLDAHPSGRPPTPEWAKACSPFTPERPHQPVPNHLAFQRPDLRSDHPLSQGYSSATGGPAAPFGNHFVDRNREWTGPNVPPWYGPGRGPPSSQKGSVAVPVVPPLHSPDFSTPGFQVPTIPPFYTANFPRPTETSRPHRDDNGQRTSRHVHIRSPPVSHMWAPELPCSSVSTATSSTGTTRSSQSTNVHIAAAPHSSASTSPSNAQASSSARRPLTDDHRDRERSLLQRPRRNVSDLKLQNTIGSSLARSPRKKAVCVRFLFLLRD